jgi:heat shock protein HslJ
MARLSTALYVTGAAVLMAATVASEGIQTRSARQAPATPLAAQPAPTLHELRNTTYKGVEEAGGAFTLVNGKWEGKPYEPGGSSRPSVTFVGDLRLVGDLDWNGSEEAAILLAANAGGTGEMSYLAVVGRPAGKITNLATALIGDRVQVRGAQIDGHRIVLEVVQVGQGDAAYCPGDLVTRSWELRSDGLNEGAPVKTGRLSTDTLAGSEWVLRSWASDEPAPSGPQVTLKFEDGRLTGSSGCNNYFAQVKAGDAPGDLKVGPAGTTRKMCAEADMSVETRFLRQLAGVTHMRFVVGQLMLSYTAKDKSIGVMLFDRRAAHSPR